MKVLRIIAKGLPLFKQELDLVFYAQQRVNEVDKESLIQLSQNTYLNTTNAFIGINASGKTTVLKTIQLALNILNNEPINHVDARTILGTTDKAVFDIYFINKDNKVCRLETEIASRKTKNGDCSYYIVDETLWEKPFQSIKSKKNLTNFEDIAPIAVRNSNNLFLADDISFIIALNKKTKDKLNICSLLSYTNINVLPFTEDIPVDIITFLDPTIEKLQFERKDTKQLIHLKFYNEKEIILNNAQELENYLSSGTIKGVITFSMVRDTLQSGGYLLIDEIENHFNKEIVMTLIRFFMDTRLNKNGGILMFTTHYPELLDEYNRNDTINIVRNRNGITIENLCNILKRNDIKKSEAYQSGFLEGTSPLYESYIHLKRSLSTLINQGG